MTGLNLISTYSSDSENEEEEPENVSECKPRDRLPLPKSIIAWKGVPHHEDVIDDPSLHDGRTRSFKHERGNWASLAYLNYTPSDVMWEWIQSTLKEFPFKCNVFTEQFHVSVTKTLILKYHWIKSFTEDLKKLCERTNRFVLELSNLRAYCNEEKTRSFLSIECFDRTGTLDGFLKELDILLREYNLPPFYEDSSYHISVFWCLGDEKLQMERIATSLNHRFTEFLSKHQEEKCFHVNEVHFKTGNQLYAFNLT